MKTVQVPPVAIHFLLAVLTTAAPAFAVDRVLHDFAPPFKVEQIWVRDLKREVADVDGRPVFRLTATKQVSRALAVFKISETERDLSAYGKIVVRVRNSGTSPVHLGARLMNTGGDHHKKSVSGETTVDPGHTADLAVDLPPVPLDLDGKTLFGMRGYPKGVMTAKGFTSADVERISLSIGNPRGGECVDVERIVAAGAASPNELPRDFFPFIDRFGQYMHRDWPGKVRSEDDLRARSASESRELDRLPGPADWNGYGGWAKGPRLKASGHFRVAKHEGTWWLVDPEGCLFFSCGIDCVRIENRTPIEDRGHWFAQPPEKTPDNREFFSVCNHVLHSEYAGRKPLCYDFTAANVKMKYGGNDWRERFAQRTHTRFRSWGINTIANWSDSRIYLMRKTPYVVTIGGQGRQIEGSKGYWGKFPDPFDPGFRPAIERNVERNAPGTANDPWCIGYFVHNELAWGSDTSLSLAALQSPADQPVKRAFVSHLRKKYKSTEALNSVWGTSHASWDALLAATHKPDEKKAGGDLRAFYTVIAEKYFREIRDAVRAAAPGRLYLGCRFAWVNDLAAKASARYCDVVSYNQYRYPEQVAAFQFPGGDDVPLIIGEFHFGALDRGMFHTGLKATRDQRHRAETYTEYVRAVLRHPQFVGCHWFQYKDQATTGRSLDGENYQIGFVDNVDTPYPEITAASRDVAASMYRYRLTNGKEKQTMQPTTVTDVPVIDFHVHLRGGMTVEKAVKRQTETDIRQGVLKNMGKGWPIETDAQLRELLNSVKDHPVFVGVQVNDRDWMTRHSPQLLKQLDYVLGDTMIMPMPGDDSPPVKLWESKQYTIDDANAWMERYMRHNLRVLKEPITILANPTYLPAAVKDKYDELWTDARMRTIIQAAIDNGVALEINARSGLPHDRFIALAKEMGARFTFGSNNFTDKQHDMSRCRDVIERFGLTKADLFVPGNATD